MSEKKRIPIPKDAQRKLLVESGHQCSVPFCGEKHTLELHHINRDPSDNKESNLIVLCANHHTMAERGRIDRQECSLYKERLKQIKPEETLKDKVEREGISVAPEHPIVSLILYLGRKYMMWRYGKPNASINKEIMLLLVLIALCFVPFFYVTLVLKALITVEWLYVSIGFLAVGTGLLVVFVVIFQRRCPNPECKGYFGIEAIDSRKVDEKVTELETETRIEKIYRNTYRCVFCGHSYTINESTEETVPKN